MISTCITDSARIEFLRGAHASTDVYKIALYVDGEKVKLDASTEEYTTANEVTNSTGYTAGGMVLAGHATSFEKGKGVLTFLPPTWEDASISARGAMIYNSSKGNKAVAIFDFGETIVSTHDAFSVKMPPATAEEGLIRLA